MTKKRILIYLSVILVFAVACAVQLAPGLIAGAVDLAETGTSQLTDEGDTVFIRDAIFTVDGKNVEATGFTVANAASGENPAEGIDLDALTPITVEKPLTGTLDKNIYVCNSYKADIYLGDLKLAEGRKIYTDGSGLNLLGGKLEAESIETTGFIAIGSADVTVNSDLTGFSGIMLFISHSDEENIVGFDTPSTLTVNGSVSNKSRYNDAAIDVANGSTMTVTGDVSTEYPVVIHSSESYGKSAFNVGGSLTVKNSPGWGFQLVYSDSVIGGDITADNWVHLYNNSTLKAGSVTAYLFAATGNSSFEIEGDVTLSNFFDVSNSDKALSYSVGGNLKCGVFSVFGPSESNKLNMHVGGDIEAGQFFLRNTAFDADGDIKKTDGGVFRFDSSEVEIAGNVNGDNFDLANCDVTIDGDLDASSSSWAFTPVKNSVLHVKGDASACQFNPMNKSEVTIDGKLTSSGSLNLNNGAKLTLNSDFELDSQATVRDASELVVHGNMTQKSALVNVRQGAQLTVDGNYVNDGGSYAGFDVQDTGTHAVIKGNFENYGGLCNSNQNAVLDVLGDVKATGTLGVINGGTMNVKGNVTASSGVWPCHNAIFNVDGNVDSGPIMEAVDGSEVYIKGDCKSTYFGAISGTTNSNGKPSSVKVDGSVDAGSYFTLQPGSVIEVGEDFTYNCETGKIEGTMTVGGDFANNTSRDDAFADKGLYVVGNLTVGGDVNMNNLILNYDNEDENISVGGIINAYRKADVIKTVDGDYVLDGVNVSQNSSPTATSYFYTVPYHTQTADIKIDGEDYITNVRNHDKDSFEPLKGGDTYNVVYILNGGAFREGAPIEYSYYTDAGIDLPTGNFTKRVGYLLAGWYDNEQLVGDPITEIPVGSTGDRTFYADWILCEHTDSTAQPGCLTPAVCTLCAAEMPALGHIWKTEWSNDESNHWHDCENCDSKNDEAEHTWKTPDWNWEDVEHPVYSRACSVCEAKKTGEADSVSDNYTAATTEADGYTTYTATVTFDNGQEFTDDHVVTDEGSMLEARKAAFDEYKNDVTADIDSLAQEGDSEQCKALINDAKEEIGALNYEENKSLEENKAAVDAIVSELEDSLAEHRKEYTATFTADGETVKEYTFTIDTFDTVIEPEVPAKEGYTGEWEEYTLGAENITVNAVYTPNEYTITYVIDGSETEVTYKCGASVEKPADPVKDGFDFIGWDAEIPETMPAENLTITAEFEAIPEPVEPTPTEPTPTEPTPTEPTPTEPTPTEPTPTEPTPTEPTPTEPTPTDTEPAHEHDYKGEVTTEPTCTEDGIMTYTCECGESYTQEIPKTGHKPGAWTVVTPATTEAAGKEVKKCEVCGETIAEREIAKLAPDTADAEIVGVNLEKINAFGIANAFGVNPEKLPAGSTVTWYVNGEKAGEGNGFQVENPTEDYTIKAVVTNRDGKVIGETEEVTIKVNNSFFARLYYRLCKLIQKVIDLFKNTGK